MMVITRRQFVEFGVRALVASTSCVRRAAALPSKETWATRAVRDGDQDELVQLMRSCVADDASFFGACSPMEWTKTWADHVVENRSQSVVVTRSGRIAAFMDVPNGLSEAGKDIPYRKAFWCGAAGVSGDIDGRERGAVFRQVVYEALRRAKALGYERVRCAAPWPGHPALARDFAAYSGVSINAFLNENGEQRYLVEWALDEAISALEAEGAASLNNAFQ